MTASSVLSVRVNEKDEQILAQMAEATGVSKSKLVAAAIHNYVEMNEWHRKVVAERIQMADRVICDQRAYQCALYQVRSRTILI